MDMTKDYYAILGVLPAAEGAVVKAAYRALAQRYHPDRFEGSEEEATERMMELNEAHAVLSDPASRRAYDQARQNRTQSADSCLDETDVRPPPGRDPLKEDWTLATQYYPDLVVLDVMLPDINGKEVCQRVRSDSTLDSVKIICISGMVEQDKVADLRAAGADDFIQKPFSVDKLLERSCDLLDIERVVAT